MLNRLKRWLWLNGLLRVTPFEAISFTRDLLRKYGYLTRR